MSDTHGNTGQERNDTPQSASRRAMVRPCFIVMDPEHSGSISTRKLVIESAKLNVITAYSGAEALETVKRYPAVDGLVCNVEVKDMPINEVVQAVKKINPRLPVIVVCPWMNKIPEADFHVPSFDPRQLLDVLQSILPAKISAILDHEDEMRDAESDRNGG